MKVNIKVAFKHKDNDDATILDKIVSKVICKWTDSEYFHCEIIIGDRWISALPEEGIYLRKLKPEISDKWDIIDFGEIEITDVQYLKIMDFVYKRIGNKYDSKGIFFSQILKVGMDDNNKWFCSELTSKILQLFLVEEYINKVPRDLSPGDIYKLSKFRIEG